jgi:hypothetical protein
MDQCLWFSIGGGLITAICVSVWKGAFTVSLPGFAILSFVCALFLGLALACLRPLLQRRASALAFLVYGAAAACFLDLYAMSATFDVFCPVWRADHGGWLGDPCSGWPVFVDFHYAAWPLYASANLALWIAGVFAALMLRTHFRTQSDRKLSDQASGNG